MLHRVLIVTVALTGCAEGVMAPNNGGDDDVQTVDAGPGSDSNGSGGSDAAPNPTPDSPPNNVAAKLILTEVVLAPSTGEFIELANPGSTPIDLSTYYLSDSGNYFRVPAGATVDSTDFIVKFPAGAQIAAGGVVTVALDTAANFQTTYGVAPTYTLGTMTTIVTSGVPSLTNAGEIVVLFQWDGASDNVRDADILLVGAPSAANGIVDKSGVVVDGPDANTTGTAYKTDARTLGPQASAPASGKSTKRTAAETGFQTGSAGNGIMGDDETTENTAMTWDTTATYSTPTPGTVPAGLM